MPAPSLPANYTTVQVRGRYVDLTGNAVAGSVVFTPSVISIQDVSAATTIVGKSVSVTLDNTGALAVSLPSTDDPDVSPNGFTYLVEERFAGFTGRSFSIAVPSSLAGSGIELSALAPTDPSPGVIRPYFLDDLFDVASASGATGDVLTRLSDGTWGPSANLATAIATEIINRTAADAAALATATGRALAFAVVFGG